MSIERPQDPLGVEFRRVYLGNLFSLDKEQFPLTSHEANPNPFFHAPE